MSDKLSENEETVRISVSITRSEYDRLQKAMFNERSMSQFARHAIVNEIEHRENRKSKEVS